jgi:hypothetical protein
MESIKPFQFSQQIHGVSVKPLSDSGKEVRIRYNGLLSASGADRVFMHFGFGDREGWQNVASRVMDRTFEGWEASVSMQDSQLNFCFRDTAQNWDNNNGLNWIYRIS